MSNEKKNDNSRNENGLGSGRIQIPESVLLRKSCRKFEMPVDRVKLKAEVDKRIAEVEEDKKTLRALSEWLIEINQESSAERDQYATEIRSYISNLEIATKDRNPAIRRIGVYELLRWRLSPRFISWEEVGKVVADLTSKGIFVLESDPEKLLCRCGKDGYIIEPSIELEPAQLADIKTWFVRIAGGIRNHTIRGWEATIGLMKHKSVISLEQLVLGEPGPCYIVVPDDLNHKDRDGRPQPLEGGHLLVDSINGKIFVEDAAGDPITEKGFAFARRLQTIKELRPKVFLAAYKLRFWSSSRNHRPEDKMSDAEQKAWTFFDQNPEHAKACSMIHASIKRAVKLAFSEGRFDNRKANVLYLPQDQRQDKIIQANTQNSEPTSMDTADKKSAKRSAKKDLKLAAVAS